MTTTTTVPTLAESPAAEALLPRRAWLWLLALGALFVVLHYNFIWRMVRIATGAWGGDWSHALIIPFISAFYVYLKRDELLATPRRIYWPGLGVVLCGLLGYAWGLSPGPGPKDMLQGYAMVLTLFGMILFLLGPAMIRLLWFPIVFLLFAVKISDRYWLGIAGHLQLIAAKLAELALNFVGIDVRVSGANIQIFKGFNDFEPYGVLKVAEACSGLRMLMAFVSMGVAVAMLTRRPWWQRLVLVASTIPIAVGVNAGRVAILSGLYLVNKEMAEGGFHKAVGMFMLLPALGLFFLLAWLMDWISGRDPAQDAAASAMPSRPVRVGGAPTRSQWVALGLLAGALLTALLGTDYAMLIAAVKPALMGEGVAAGWMTGLVVGAAALIAAVWGLRHIARRGRAAGAGGERDLSLGLVAGILGAAVLGLNTIVWANGYVFHKKELPLRQPLLSIPDRIGPWEKLDEMTLTEDEAEILSASAYINRNYVNVAAAGQPGSTIRFHLAYYTGTPDTVPHVPEWCLVMGGAQTLGKGKVPLSLSGPGYAPAPEGGVLAPTQRRGEVHVPATAFNASAFTYAEPRNASIRSNVIYFFAANGKLLASPQEVRIEGFDLTDRYSYYCKIEVGVPGIGDPKEAAEKASEFLSLAMPEIMAVLPDWRDVQAGRWPAER